MQKVSIKMVRFWEESQFVLDRARFVLDRAWFVLDRARIFSEMARIWIFRECANCQSK